MRAAAVGTRRSSNSSPGVRFGAYGLMSATLGLLGCRGSEPPRPALSVEEFDEVRRHRMMIDPEQEEAYFSSARGKELTARMLKKVFGDRGLSILRGATRAEVFRVTDASVSEPRITSAAKELGQGLVAKLATYLLDGRIYFTSPDCEIFGPGVVIRLWRGRESVTLVVRCKCEYLDVSVHDTSGVRLHHRGTYYRGPFGDPDVIGGLIEEAFPGDRSEVPPGGAPTEAPRPSRPARPNRPGRKPLRACRP